MTRSLQAILVIGMMTAAASAAHATPATERWSITLPGDPDGVAIARDSAGNRLVAVTINGGSYPPAAPAPGSLALVDDAGTVQWTFTAESDINGEPGVGDVDGDGDDEFAVCEASPTGRCYLLESDGSVLWTSGPYYHPSVWTAGPHIIDVDADGSVEVVFATWGGAIVALDAITGAKKWSFDAWAAFGETFHSRVTIGNLDDDPSLEVVAFGYVRGLVLIVDGETGTLQASSTSLFDLYGNYGVGNTPVIADFDGSGQPELVINAVQGNGGGAVIALDASGAVVWRSAVPERLFWSGPIAADANGDGNLDVYIQGGSPTACRLRRLKGSDGALIGEQVIGLRGWFQPVFAYVDLDGMPDVVAVPWDGLEAVTGELQPIFSHSAPGGGIWRGAAEDIDGNGAADVFVTDWFTGRLTRLELSSPMPGPGPGGGGMGGGQLVPDLNALALATDELLARVSTGHHHHLEHAARDLRKALAEAAVGHDHKKVLKEASKALDELFKLGPEVDVSGLISQLITTMLYSTEDLIDRRMAITSDTDSAVLEAHNLVMQAEALFALGDRDSIEDGMKLLEDAAKEADKHLDYESSNCPATSGDVRLTHECALVDVRDDLAALIAGGSAGSNDLDKALSDLEKSIGEAAETHRHHILTNAKKADDDLEKAIDHGADATTVNAIRADLAQTISEVVNRAVADVTLIAGDTGPDVTAANAALLEAEAYRAAGDFDRAHDAYDRAFRAARRAV